MATVTAFEIGQPARRNAPDQAAKLSLSTSRGLIGGVLFLLIAFFLLAAGAVAGAPHESGAPVEAGAFNLDPSIGSAQA
jgi:hypothetical protein